jgi:beta-mannosidase
VWHQRHPVKDYEKYRFRFCSEFGMQSYSSPETQATFCSPEDGNVFGPTMENHQKNRSGNQIILDYVSRRYRFPNGQDNLIYLSQLNQAFCMQTGVEHWRRHMPRCMGALYWQLNDCWPVASWSSIEFTGHWKALQYIARRFFAPALVTAHVPGDESPTIGNYRHSTIEQAEIFTVYDAPESAKGVVSWSLEKLEGGQILHGKKSVHLRYGESVRRATIDLRRHLAKFGRDHIYLRISLDVGGARVSEDTVFFAPPRFINLPKARTRVGVRRVKSGHFKISFTSDAFQHRFAFDLSGLSHASSDNFFELHPGEKKVVNVRVAGSHSAGQVRKKLKHRSLADTY